MARARPSKHYDSPRQNQFIGCVQVDPKHNIARAAQAENINPCSACDIWHKFNETGTTHCRPGQGRPSELTHFKTKRRVLREALKDQRAPFKEVANNLDTSTSAVKTTLHAAGYHCCVAKQVVFINEQQRKKRLAFAQEMACCHGWDDIAWSDECYVIADGSHGPTFVTRRPEEKWDPACVVPKFKQSNVRVMVWGCMMHGRKGPLLVLDYPGGKGNGMGGKRYVQQVLEGAWKQFHVQAEVQLGRKLLFQQDGAPAHRSKLAQKWFTDNNVSLFPHPPSSPDLSPIEALWGMLKSHLHARRRIPTSRTELEAALQDGWAQITLDQINNLVAPMPARIQAVISAKGGHTMY
jgi:hypothetical protein